MADITDLVKDYDSYKKEEAQNRDVKSYLKSKEEAEEKQAQEDQEYYERYATDTMTAADKKRFKAEMKELDEREEESN